MAASTWRPAQNLKKGNLVRSRTGKTFIVKEAPVVDPEDGNYVFVAFHGVDAPSRLEREKHVQVVDVREATT